MTKFITGDDVFHMRKHETGVVHSVRIDSPPYNVLLDTKPIVMQPSYPLDLVKIPAKNVWHEMPAYFVKLVEGVVITQPDGEKKRDAIIVFYKNINGSRGPRINVGRRPRTK